MIYAISKVIITSLIIVAISELSKRSAFFGALLASLPLVSILAMMWLYIDTRDVENVAALASRVFWLVIPSLLFFISLPFLLKKGMNFYLSMGLSMLATAACYLLMIKCLAYFNIKL